MGMLFIAVCPIMRNGTGAFLESVGMIGDTPSYSNMVLHCRL